MSTAEALPPWVRPEEYLRLERAAPTKSEWFRGVIHAMTGASRSHNRITFNLSTLVGPQIRGTRCEGFANDMRVRVGDNDPLFAYPDLVIACADTELDQSPDDDTLTNPTVLVEVLSPSTERFDRGEKSAAYRRTPSLREYALISQDQPRVEHYVRQPSVSGEGVSWLLTELTGLSAVLRFSSVPCEIPLSALYENVTFSPATSEP